MSGHLSLNDVAALKYHLETGGIMDEDYYMEVTLHLDECQACRNRYYEDEHGIMRDRRERIEEEILEMSKGILNEALMKDITDKEGFEKFCETRSKSSGFDDLLAQYKLTGGTIVELAKYITEKMQSSIAEMFIINGKA